MSRLERRFAELAEAGDGALVVFAVAGHPTQAEAAKALGEIAAAGADVIERLAVRDGQDPAAQVRRVPEPGICAQRGEPRLLVAVVCVGAADERDQEPVDVACVRVEQLLKGWKCRHYR